jgi:hypothetical protein
MESTTTTRELKVGDEVRFVNPKFPTYLGVRGTITSFHSEGRRALLSTGNLFKVRNLELVEATPPAAAAVTSPCLTCEYRLNHAMEAPCDSCTGTDPHGTDRHTPIKLKLDTKEYIQAIWEAIPSDPKEPEYTGGSVNYYRVAIDNPTMEGVDPYTAECNDIIEALNMNYAEGNAFKALWRRCAARLGKSKKGYTDGLYDAQKVVFFGERLVAQHKAGPDAAE